MIDLVQLDAYLSSDASPDECLALSDLHGFLTGILCSPSLVPPSEWLPIVWGEEMQGSVDMEPQIWAIQEVMALYNEIALGLNNEPPFLEPIFWQAPEGHCIAMDWCEGFQLAYDLRKDEWGQLTHTKTGQQWLYPIRAHLFDEDGNSLIGAFETELDAILDKAADQIPEAVCNIYTFWKSKRAVRN